MVRLKNPHTGLIVEAPTGFSWTTFFFGFFVPLFRSNFGYAGIMFVASLVTFGFSNLVFPFLINKHHVKHLVEKGYMPASAEDVNVIRSMGIGYSGPSTPPPMKQAA